MTDPWGNEFTPPDPLALHCVTSPGGYLFRAIETTVRDYLDDYVKGIKKNTVMSAEWRSNDVRCAVVIPMPDGFDGGILGSLMGPNFTLRASVFATLAKARSRHEGVTPEQMEAVATRLEQEAASFRRKAAKMRRGD